MVNPTLGKELQQRPTIAITGAAGLVGGHLTRYLVIRGYLVKAIVRTQESASQLKEAIGSAKNFTVAIADVLDHDALFNAVNGANVLVHAAGSVDPYGNRSKIFATNVDGTKMALRVAQEAGLQQFIQISSLSVITKQGDQYNVNENAPLRLCGEAYADSKVEAEKAVMNCAIEKSLNVSVLRPGFIYGPNERSWMPRLINSIATGKAMLIDGGKKETNVIYVGNLSTAIEGAILNSNAYGQVYNLTDGEQISKKELFDAVADGLSLSRVSKVVPGALARIAVETISTIAPLLSVESQRKLARYSRAAFRLAGINQGFSIAKAERDLGYTKRVPFREAMHETLIHFKNNTDAKKETALNLRV